MRALVDDVARVVCVYAPDPRIAHRIPLPAARNCTINLKKWYYSRALPQDDSASGQWSGEVQQPPLNSARGRALPLPPDGARRTLPRTRGAGGDGSAERQRRYMNSSSFSSQSAGKGVRRRFWSSASKRATPPPSLAEDSGGDGIRTLPHGWAPRPKPATRAHPDREKRASPSIPPSAAHGTASATQGRCSNHRAKLFSPIYGDFSGQTLNISWGSPVGGSALSVCRYGLCIRKKTAPFTATSDEMALRNSPTRGAPPGRRGTFRRTGSTRSSAGARTGVRVRYPAGRPSGACATGGCELRHPELSGGWVCFTCDREKRRLSPPPEQWDAASDAELEALCAQARQQPVPAA